MLQITESMTCYNIGDPSNRTRWFTSSKKTQNVIPSKQKICRYTLHQELLQSYKKKKKFPKAMLLTLILSLHNNMETKKTLQKYLKKWVFQIKRHPAWIVNLASEKTNLVRTVKENSTVEELKLISQFIANKINKLSSKNKKRRQRNYDRDHITTLESKCRNRRFT